MAGPSLIQLPEIPMLPFSNERLADARIILGTSGGPQFKTNIVETHSGGETRNIVWTAAKSKFEFGSRSVLSDDLENITRFFYARRGRAQPFRFKSFADFRVKREDGLLVQVAGQPTAWRLYKQYISGAETYMRRIQKPVPGTVKLYEDGVPVVASFNYDTGVATYAKTSPTAVLSWTGEFDVPVRFDVDGFEPEFAGYDPDTKEGLFALPSMPLWEVRINEEGQGVE